MNGPHFRIRTLRRLQKRTLREVAAACGFTESLLSKIEGGKTNPPLATLTRIAAALGVSLSDLLDEGHAQSAQMTPASALETGEPTPTAKGYGFQVLAPMRGGKLMQPFLFVAKKGGVQAGALSHVGEEWIYVLEGRMKYRVGATTYTLGPGDSLYFDAEEEHDFEPLSDVVRYLGVFSERPGRAEKDDL